MNPTVAAFEERIANLEGGVGAVAFASGLAAQTAALFTMLEPGDHVVASSALYGGTVTQLKHLLRKLSIGLTFVDPDRRRRVAQRVDRQNQTAVRRDDRQSGRQRARHRSARADRARTRRAADGRQHVRNAVSVPPVRVGRRHRRAFGDEVHRRSRHEHRWRRRRQRNVRLVERPLSGRRGAVAGVSRPQVPRELRHLRLPDEVARRNAARPRRRARAVERVLVHAGARDVAAADAGARRQRARCGAFSRRRSARRTRAIRGSRRQPVPAACARNTCRAAPAPCSASISPAGATPDARSSSRCSCFRTSPTSATRRASSFIRRARRTGSSTTRNSTPAGIGPGTIRLSIGIEDADDLIWDLRDALDVVAAPR